MDMISYNGDAWKVAQRSVIGSLLIAPDKCAGEIFQRARREHFSDGSLLHIFDTPSGLETGRSMPSLSSLPPAIHTRP